MSGWMGLHRGPLLDELRKDPNAFVLLSLIADRARWQDGRNPVNGLEFGQAFLSTNEKTCEAIGLKASERQQLRGALRRLKKMGFITTRGTTRGTIVTLINQSVFSITKNPATTPTTSQQPASNQPATSQQPLTNKETKKHRNKGERARAPAPEATGPGESGSAASLSLSDSGLSDCGDLREHLAKVFPNAPGTYSKTEKEALAESREILREATPDDWDALRVWIIEADDKSRGCKLWPSNRSQFLQHAGEALEKVRTWWTDAGRGWWKQEQAKRARRAAKAKEPPPKDETEEPLSREEAVAFWNAPLESQAAPQPSTPPGSQKKTG